MPSSLPTPPHRVLVVEDETKLARLLEQALSESGFEVTLASNGEEGEKMAIGKDVAIVDVMMPVLDGFSMVRRLRQEDNWLPVLFLTARDTPEDVVAGLSLGGDDYLAKPFLLNELVARIRSLLRRAGARSNELRHGELVLDLNQKAAFRGGRPLFLSATEYRLLLALMRRPGEVVSKDEVLKEVWRDEDARLADNVVEVYVHYLRSKLEAFGQPRILNTIKGLGYVLETPTQPH